MKMRSPIFCLLATLGGLGVNACASSDSGVAEDARPTMTTGTGGSGNTTGSGGTIATGTGGADMLGDACAAPTSAGGTTAGGGGSSDGGGFSIPTGPYVKPTAKPSPGCGKASAGAGSKSITVAGRNIPYIVDTGGYDSNNPNRLIFTLHGCGGYGGLIHLPGLTPNLHVQWQGQDKGCYSDQTRDSPEYAVFDALLDFIENNYCIDENRIFATGFSSGSWMADMLGCQRANIVKAHGQGAGGLPVSIRPAGDCRGPEAALYEHGTGDDQNHIHGSRMDRDRLIKTNQCDTTSKPYPNFSPCVQYDNCLPGYPIAYCEIPGLGHSPWSNMSQVIGNFFSQF